MLEQIHQMHECEVGLEEELSTQKRLQSRMDELLERERQTMHQLKEKAQCFQKSQLDVSRLELQLNALEEDRAKAEKQRQAAQNEKMLRTVDSRLSQLTEERDRVETSLLEAIEAQEQIEALVRELKAGGDRAAQERASETPDLSEQLQRSQRRYHELQEEHEGLFEGTTSRFLKMHETARRQLKRDRVLFGVDEDGNCTHCGMQLAQADFLQIRYKEDVKACPSCSAVLYWIP